MPNFLELTDRVTGKSYQSRALIEVDERMCEALGVTVDPVTFYMAWVDWMPLYVTNDWAKVRAAYSDCPDRASILDFLETNYELAGYATIGRS